MNMKLSKAKRDRISEQILSFLYHSFPKQLFTAEISRELARDEEFIKNLLYELKDKGIVSAIKKSATGADFIRRVKWQLTAKAYAAYSEKVNQSKQ